MNESISILNSVELLPLDDADVNPFLTKVRIKVFHLGENRNHSYIDKDTAIKMAKTLRGNPIVARYREEKEDFTDHGHEIIINDKGIEEKVLTKPYGFVDLNARVWFEDFDDTDEFGRIVRHTYLVTEGQIWTEQYQELKKTILDGGRPQSMELHEPTLEGHWSDEINSYCSVFIINDAIITKLCALGADTEPCFLGSSITPDFNLSEEDSFVKELLELKNKFKFALQQEGGLSMDKQETPAVEPVVENSAPAAGSTENFSSNEGNSVIEPSSNVENNTGEFAKKDPEENKDDNSKEEPKEKSEEPEDKNGKEPEKDKNEEKEEDKDKKPETKHSLHSDEEFDALQAELSELKTNFASLEEENKKLVAFKQEVEDKQKDEMIASFYMLSDEDKKDVIANKANYSLDDIKAKLSIICVDKRVDFSLGETDKNTHVEEPVVTFNLDSHEVDTLPAWLKAVKAVQDNQ